MAALIFFFSLLLLPVESKAAERYITPAGGGLKDGSSYSNAYDASAGGIEACWESIGPGDTCRIGADTYRNISVKLSSGGEKDKFKKLAGQKTPFNNRPYFAGGWSKDKPDKGPSFIMLGPEADSIHIEWLGISNCQYSIRNTKKGRNDHLKITDIVIRDTRIGIEIYGDGNCSSGPIHSEGCPEPLEASHDIEIQNVTIQGATKTGIRFRYGVYRALLKNCDVDMGGAAYDADPAGDMVGFSLGDGKNAGHDSPDRDITYVDCTARNAYDNAGKEYWQGDGFKSENYSTGVRYIRCRAFDNTDGGFDVKGPGTELRDSIAARNKRNFRLWNVNKNKAGRARLKNCLGHHAKFWGDKNHSVADLHLFGDALIQNSTFHNTLDVPPSTGAFIIHQETNYYKEGFTTELRDSLYSRDRADSPGTALKHIESSKKAKSFIEEIRTASWDAADPSTKDTHPDYVNPSPDFEGGAEDYNSRYGKNKGYFSERAR